MVESVSAISAATSVKDVKELKETDKVDKQETEKAKKTQETEKTDATEKSSYAFDRVTIQNKVKDYIENLKKTHDYPIVQMELTRYLDLFKVDDFMKKYPNIRTDSDFMTIMYNETVQYL